MTFLFTRHQCFLIGFLFSYSSGLRQSTTARPIKLCSCRTKCLSTALAAGMVLSLAGCGGSPISSAAASTASTAATGEASAAGGNPVSDKPLTISFIYSGDYNPEYKSLAKMTELTNVTHDATAIPDSDYDTVPS